MTQKTFPPVPINPTQENTIMEHGLNMIFQDGVKSFTVETLAKDLVMSKKTIYKYFPTKDILLQRIFHYITTLIAGHFQKILAKNMDPLDKYQSAVNEVIKTLNRVSITRIVELKARYPHIWKQIEAFRMERRDDFLSIFVQAREAGYIRQDLDLELTATLFMNIINDVFQPEFFIRNHMNPNEVLLNFSNIFLRGMVTQTGLKHIEEQR